MATVKDIVQHYGVNDQTVRNWGVEFKSYLDEGANPPKGRTRVYSTDDLQVIDLIAAMRREKRPYDEIHAALSAGQFGSAPDFEQPPPKQNGQNGQVGGSIDTIDRLQQFMERAIAPYQDQIIRLENAVKEARDDHMEAEKRGVKLEAEVEHLHGDKAELEGQLEALEVKLEELVNRPWYRRLFGG